MRFTVSILIILALSQSACVTVKPPIRIAGSSTVGWYTVKTTDTLYSIAWRYGLDYKQLARWNRINVNAPIHPGQRLLLVEPRQPDQAKSSRVQKSLPEKTKVKPQLADSKVIETDDFKFKNPVAWVWPTEGKSLNSFSAATLDRRGIDIAGQSGQPVRSVAAGKVVYSGNGLADYGNLIIIKHSDTYLSAYAYCQERLVQEGVEVAAGTMVAKMGQKDNTAKLHFEIRKNGKPVDPLKYLPKR